MEPGTVATVNVTIAAERYRRPRSISDVSSYLIISDSTLLLVMILDNVCEELIHSKPVLLMFDSLDNLVVLFSNLMSCQKDFRLKGTGW